MAYMSIDVMVHLGSLYSTAFILPIFMRAAEAVIVNKTNVH